MDRTYLMLRVACTTVAGLLCCFVLAGCASHPGPAGGPESEDNAQQWIGRWVGQDDRHYLQIMPVKRSGHYRLTIRNGYPRPRHYDAWTVADGLDFKQDGSATTIRPGNGEDSPHPALATLDNCLRVRHSDHRPVHIYCRRPATADALPLQRGAYTRVRTHCWNAVPADRIYYDGTGIARSDQRACRASIMSQQGVIYTLADSCARSVSGHRSTRQIQITVADDTHFALQPFDGQTTLYQYCPGRPIPASTDSQ